MQRNQLNIEWILENHLSFLHKFGLNESKIREHFEVWKVGKISTSVNDYFWYIHQNILTEIAAQVSDEEQMCQLNYDTYYIMWEFLSYVENKNGNHIKRLMHKNEIRLWQIREGIFKKNVVIISNKCCDYCKTLNDKYVFQSVQYS